MIDGNFELISEMRQDLAIIRAEIIELRREAGEVKAIISDLPSESSIAKNELPEMIRIPTQGRCPHTGLSRSKIYRLIDAGKIKKKVAKTLPTEKSGTAYILGSSVKAYFARLP